MAEALWFRVEAGLPDSDGARVLERRLEVDRAWAFAVAMWDWFVLRHPEGQVVGPDAAFLIARGSGWTGEADKFCAAMVAAEYLAPIPEGFRVRGWKAWAGYHLEVRSRGAKRQRDSRVRSRAHNGDVTVTSPEKDPPRDDCHCDPSPISVSGSVSKGGAGGRRRVGIGGNPPPDPCAEKWPLTAAVLAALDGRKVEALWPAEKSADRVERVIELAGFERALEHFAAALPGSPNKWLTFHVDALAPRASRGPQPVSTDFSESLEDVARRLEGKHGRPA